MITFQLTLSNELESKLTSSQQILVPNLNALSRNIKLFLDSLVNAISNWPITWIELLTWRCSSKKKTMNRLKMIVMEVDHLSCWKKVHLITLTLNHI